MFFKSCYTEAIFLVVNDPPMNELWTTNFDFDNVLGNVWILEFLVGTDSQKVWLVSELGRTNIWKKISFTGIFWLQYLCLQNLFSRFISVKFFHYIDIYGIFKSKHWFIGIYFNKVGSQLVFFCKRTFKTHSQLKIPKKLVHS